MTDYDTRSQEGGVIDAAAFVHMGAHADMRPERFDEDREREEETPCSTCGRADGEAEHWAGCPEPMIEDAERFSDRGE